MKGVCMRFSYALLRMRCRTCVLVACWSALVGSGCAAGDEASPFVADAGSAVDAAPDAAGDAPSDGPILGGPCLESDQCNDGVDCTFDACNLTVHRCQFTPDDSRCQNAMYCDGVERCDPLFGCRPGTPQ